MLVIAVWSVIVLVIVVFSLAGYTTVQQQERRMVEFFGKYFKTLRPGLRWIVPGVMKIRATVSIWEQSVSLFSEPIKIDFKDGSAVPKGAEVFVKMKSPDIPYKVDDNDEAKSGAYRAIYEIDNWRTAVKKLMENTVRSYLNGLTIDEGVTMTKAGFDLKDRLPKGELKRVETALASWGFELKKVTVTDFDLEPDLVKARGEVQKRKRERETSEEERKIRALETMGSLISMVSLYTGEKEKDIQKEIRGNKKLKKKFFDVSTDMITRRMSIDGNALTDIRTQGGDKGFEGSFLDLIAAYKKI